MIDFGVVKGPSSNSLLKRYNSEAAKKQSLEDESLEAMLRMETGNPDLQITDKYNEYEDEKPRKPLTPSSSFIEGIKYFPSMNKAVITIGGVDYSFDPGHGNGFSPDEMARFLNSPSLEDYLWSHNKFISKQRK